jgi:alpha-L-rhamnosidase
VLATGTDKGFNAFQLKERLQKVERYSFQRPFTEYYRVTENSGLWRTSAETPAEPLKLTIQPNINLLPRNLLMPEFEVVCPVEIHSQGIIAFQKPEKYRKDRSLTNISEKLKGYPETELEVLPSQLMQEIFSEKMDTLRQPFAGNPIVLKENEFVTFTFSANLSGFIGAKVSCAKPSKLVFYFDEMLTGGDVVTKQRMGDVNNQVVYELAPGTYNLETFESYTFKFL